MSSFTGMSCAQLFKKIGTPNAPRIIDTRLAEDYARDTALIPSSRRILHQTVLNTLQDKPQDTPTAKTVVVCQQGHKSFQWDSSRFARARGACRSLERRILRLA